ncbi:MAG TPA: GIY-YIG nuclease family protein [Gammaproteobacteria bacterium]|nr:GIY-YIG nuclease family protein [Gammaproteobacteria bacterium]
MHKRHPAIYIMANKRNGTLYVGVTSNLQKRIYQHKYAKLEGFTKRYDCKLLVYYEQHADMNSAIEREKQIKGGSRKKKLALIESINPKWLDLYDSLF